MEITCIYDHGRKDRPEVHRSQIVEPVVRRCESCLGPLCAFCGYADGDKNYCNECWTNVPHPIPEMEVNTIVQSITSNEKEV